MTIKDELIKKREVKAKNGFGYFYIQNEKEISGYYGSSGMSDLTSIIYGYGVGFKKLYEPFLSRTIDWLSTGIENKEELGDLKFHQYKLNSELAVANWLHSGVNDISLWKNAVAWQEALYSDEDFLENIGKIRKEEYALQMLHYIQAQEYKKAIQLYQSINGDKPFKLNKNMGGIRVAYAYCLHFYENKFTVEQLENASRGFLEKELVMLYTMGRPTEMLYWLKMVCDAREKDYTPEEVIYSFYEYIPEQEKPDFIKELLDEKEPEKKSFFSIFKW
ncbi:hypothetical protein ACWIUA_10670 [Ursidibacter sp. B-7004-1]